GKETTHEVLRKDQDFSFREGFRMQIPKHLIFEHPKLDEENVKIVRDFVAGKLKHLIGRLQKNIINAIDLYIGECVKPKVIRYPRKTLADIIAIPVSNIIAGEECYNNEDMLETFKSLSFSLIMIIIIPPILFFIHPWLHRQIIT
ncbi:40372_t:CDS:2, partial [Gigaspora margarita]